MGSMKYPVRVYEVGRTAGAPATKKTDFEVIASSLESCRQIVKAKVAEEGFDLRTLSFSPDPEPLGSVIVYVWKGEDPTRVKRKKPVNKPRRQTAR